LLSRRLKTKTAAKPVPPKINFAGKSACKSSAKQLQKLAIEQQIPFSFSDEKRNHTPYPFTHKPKDRTMLAITP